MTDPQSNRPYVAARLREMADAIEATGKVESMVAVFAGQPSDPDPTVYILGQNAITAVMHASATLEALIESLPSNATNIQ